VPSLPSGRYALWAGLAPARLHQLLPACAGGRSHQTLVLERKPGKEEFRLQAARRRTMSPLNSADGLKLIAEKVVPAALTPKIVHAE
jgi:hypothetical protein